MKKCWQKSIGSVCLFVLFFDWLLPCLSETEPGACASVMSYKKCILTHLYEFRFFENPVKLLYVLPSPNVKVLIMPFLSYGLLI